jgi:hypothetical protein
MENQANNVAAITGYERKVPPLQHRNKITLRRGVSAILVSALMLPELKHFIPPLTVS